MGSAENTPTTTSSTPNMAAEGSIRSPGAGSAGVQSVDDPEPNSSPDAETGVDPISAKPGSVLSARPGATGGNTKTSVSTQPTSESSPGEEGSNPVYGNGDTDSASSDGKNGNADTVPTVMSAPNMAIEGSIASPGSTNGVNSVESPAATDPLVSPSVLEVTGSIRSSETRRLRGSM